MEDTSGFSVSVFSLEFLACFFFLLSFSRYWWWVLQISAWENCKTLLLQSQVDMLNVHDSSCASQGRQLLLKYIDDNDQVPCFTANLPILSLLSLVTEITDAAFFIILYAARLSIICSLCLPLSTLLLTNAKHLFWVIQLFCYCFTTMMFVFWNRVTT